jgi:hypothetical protein
VELVDGAADTAAATGHEGVYRAVNWIEAMRRFHKAKREVTQRQLELI